MEWEKLQAATAEGEPLYLQLPSIQCRQSTDFLLLSRSSAFFTPCMWCCCSHFTPLLHTPLNSHDRQMSGIVIITPAILPIRRYRRKKKKEKKKKKKKRRSNSNSSSSRSNRKPSGDIKVTEYSPMWLTPAMASREMALLCQWALCFAKATYAIVLKSPPFFLDSS